MRVRWVVAGLVALAGFALSIVSGTYSAPTRSVDVGGNHLAAGVLRLQLSSGAAPVEFSFPGLLPGATQDQRVWLANDPSSPVAATVALTLDRLADVPADGLLSRLLELQLAAARTDTSAAGCADTTVAPMTLPAVGAGNLRALARDAGTRIPITAPDGSVVVLAPGEGLCLAVSAYWPPSAVDNEAQGDAIDVHVLFELRQVLP